MHLQNVCRSEFDYGCYRIGIASYAHRKEIISQINLLRPLNHTSAPIAGRVSPLPSSSEVIYGIDEGEEDAESGSAAELIQAMWRGHHSRSQFGQHVNIVRRYEQLKGVVETSQTSGRSHIAQKGATAGRPKTPLDDTPLDDRGLQVCTTIPRTAMWFSRVSSPISSTDVYWPVERAGVHWRATAGAAGAV
jgi:hypothetical protein